MQEKHVSRRDFMKAIGLAGIGSAVVSSPVLAEDTNAPAAAAAAPEITVPLRPFGKTGVKVSKLGLGGQFDATSSQIIAYRAHQCGVRYWDTANGYSNGNCERGLGMYFGKNPSHRKDIFLVTKADEGNSAGFTQRLEESLERMKTDYIDLYFIHGLRSPDQLNDEIKQWAEKAKAAKKIRFFGFSVHANMDVCLQAAAKAGWIDGIMLKYDFRLMRDDKLRAALDACEKAGIGLTAMKTQSKDPNKVESEADVKLSANLMRSGFTEEQAKLMAVWENPQIACVCSLMTSVTILNANIAAALNKSKLSAADHAALREYALNTESRHCAGCTRLCENALGNQVPVGDVMRSLMYHNSYGDSKLAKEVFANVPQALRARMASLDYSAAEQICPQRLPIAQLMRKATEVLA